MSDSVHLDAKRRILAAIAGTGYADACEGAEKESLEPIEPEDDAYEPPAPAAIVAESPLRRPLSDQFNDGETVHLLPPVHTAAEVVGHESAGRQVFDAYIASRISPRTRETMVSSLRRVARLLGSPTPECIPWPALRFQHTDAVRAQLLNGTYSRSTVLLTLEALKGVLRHATRMGLMPVEEFHRASDWDRIRLQSLPAGRELTQDEISAVHRYLDALVVPPYRSFLEALFALLLGTGLRAIEACRMSVEAYDPTGYLTLRRKGDKDDVLPLGEVEIRALDRWLEQRERLDADSPALLLRVHPGGWVGAKTAECDEKYLRRVCARIAREAKVGEFAPHDLRRTFCTRALRISNDPFLVQTLMGHSKVDTTRKYDKRALEEHAAKRRHWDIWRAPEVPRGGPSELKPGLLKDWIANGDVRIEEVDLAAFESHPSLRTYQAGSRLSDGGNASAEHQRLCGLAALYLESIGRPFTFERGRCWYAGGIADVVALDGSLFVECGNVTWESKPLAALCSGLTLMIVPYRTSGSPIGYIVRPLTDAPRRWADERGREARRQWDVFTDRMVPANSEMVPEDPGPT